MRRLTAALVVVAALVALCPLVASAPASADRRFGDTPLDDVLYWADQERACGLGRDQLAAMMLAPTWPETGAPTTQSPSPMTLSRWDTNPALGAFGTTEFPRAWWHPGISGWQLDDSGFASAFDARQRIDTYVAASRVADVMATRWCTNPSLAYVWAPWAACRNDVCAAIYDEIYDASTGQLRAVVRDAAVGREGGIEERTCRTPTKLTDFPCWRVDPALAQGYRAWVSPAFGPSPITAPFYVYSDGTFEYRHWLRSDTGYAEDVWAQRPLGQNSRSALTWNQGHALCDVTAGGGACCPTLTAGSSCGSVTVGGTYRPVSGDFDGNGRDDVLWYAPGSAADRLWSSTTSGSFRSSSVTVGGDYEPVSGDFDGDGRDDVLWYAAGPTQDYVWYGNARGAFTGQRVKASGTWTPVVGDYDGDGHDDVVWYGSGTVADFVWYGGNRRFTGGSLIVRGIGYRPVSGDFDGDGRADVFWYAPGAAADVVWWGAPGRTFTGAQQSVGGDFEPVAGRLNRGRRVDVLWYGQGAAADSLWLARAGRVFEPLTVAVGGEFVPFPGDFDGDGTDDVFFYGPGPAGDAITYGG